MHGNLRSAISWLCLALWGGLGTLFILHYIKCQNSATVIAKQSSLAEKGWLRRSFCLLNSLDSDSRCRYFKLGADIAFLVLHQTQSPSQTLQYAKNFFASQHSFKIWTKLHISVGTSENILQFLWLCDKLDKSWLIDKLLILSMKLTYRKKMTLESIRNTCNV